MSRTTLRKPVIRTALASVLTLSAFGVTACGDEAGDEQGTSVEDIQEEDQEVDPDVDADVDADTEPSGDADWAFEGDFDADFVDSANDYAGEQVIVSAAVNEVVSDNAFTIAGTDDTSADEMLVVGTDANPMLESDVAVSVTGTVQESFDLATVEENLGVDLDDELFEDWDGQTYIEASNIDTSVTSDQ